MVHIITTLTLKKQLRWNNEISEKKVLHVKA